MIAFNASDNASAADGAYGYLPFNCDSLYNVPILTCIIMSEKNATNAGEMIVDACSVTVIAWNSPLVSRCVVGVRKGTWFVYIYI